MNGDSASRLLSLVIVMAGFGVMLLFLRWTFSSGTSLVQRRPRQGGERDYGLFVPVASPGTMTQHLSSTHVQTISIWSPSLCLQIF